MNIWHRKSPSGKLTLTLLCLTSFAAIPNSASASVEYANITANVGFANVDIMKNAFPGVNPVRFELLKEAASTLGARGALAWRSVQINHLLNEQAKKLDNIFNFNRLILDNNVLPPIITQSNSNLKLSASNVIRTDSKIYQILSAARFVTTPPTWRDYLYMSYCKPSIPDRSTLPNSEEEVKVWNTYLNKGWRRGLDQANSIFIANLSRLKRNMLGMITFRELLAEKMVNAPFIAQSHFGVTGNPNELRINDRVIRITNPSKLQTNSKRWNPVFTG